MVTLTLCTKVPRTELRGKMIKKKDFKIGSENVLIISKKVTEKFTPKRQINQELLTQTQLVT